MSNIKVNAKPLRGLRVRTPAERPDLAILEIQIKGGAEHYVLPKDKLRALADHLNKAADAAEKETKPQSGN